MDVAALFDPALSDFALRSAVTLFVVIDPIGLAPLFVALTAGRSRAERRRIALSALSVAAGVLTLFGAAGETLITAIGVGLPAFRISGGMMLFLIAVEMLFERRNEQREKTATEAQGGDADRSTSDPTVFPLATPLLAGPGAMAAMILLTARAETPMETAAVYLCLAVVLVICLALFLMAPLIERALGPTGVKLVTRLLGVLLAALAVQFVLDGLADFGVVTRADAAG